jgi:hypothetical protein
MLIVAGIGPASRDVLDGLSDDLGQLGIAGGWRVWGMIPLPWVCGAAYRRDRALAIPGGLADDPGRRAWPPDLAGGVERPGPAGGGGLRGWGGLDRRPGRAGPGGVEGAAVGGRGAGGLGSGTEAYFRGTAATRGGVTRPTDGVGYTFSTSKGS